MKSESCVSKYKALLLLWTFLVVLAIFTIKLNFLDSDTYFIIATGEYISENAVVPQINPFVIHENFTIIVQQWLFDVLIYQVYNLFGFIGLYAYIITVFFISVFSVYKFVGLYSKDIYARTLATIIYSSFALPFMTCRPTSLSFLLCLAVVAAMERYRLTKSKKCLFTLPLVSILMINVHAAMWPIMFVLMLPFIAPDNFPKTTSKYDVSMLFKKWIDDKIPILLSIIFMAICGSFNPNGFDGMAYVFLSYGEATNNALITELQSPNIASGMGAAVIAAILCLMWYLLRFKSKGNFALVYMTLGTIVLASLHQRNAWFLFFGMLPLTAIMIDCLSEKEREVVKPNKEKKFIEIIVVTVFLFLSLAFVAFQDEIIDGETTPVLAADYLDNQSKDDMVLFTEFNNGAFMEFRGYKVYIDARPELFQRRINKSSNIYDEYLALRYGEIDFEEFLDKYKFTHLVVLDANILTGYLYACDEYELVVDGQGYKLYQTVATKPTSLKLLDESPN